MNDSLCAKLVPISNKDQLEEAYEIHDSATVGRHPSNTIVMGLDSVSRFHARIDKRGSFYILQDLNSSNGTMVNNERITQMTLHHRDMVTFGAIEFEFLNESPSQAPTADDEPLGGMSIVEFTDDLERGDKPQTHSVIHSEEMDALGDKSSFFEVSPKERTDSHALLRVNNRLATLYKLSELIREIEDMSEKDALQRVLDLLFEAITADRGVIMTRYAPEANELEVQAVKYRDQPITPSRVSISRTILEQVLKDKVAVLSQDAQMDSRFDASESIMVNQIRSAICVPMTQAGIVMGVIHMDTSSSARPFEKEDLSFVTMIARELSLALENHRMRQEAVHRERLAAVGETVAGISHNVKNILLMMQGGSELLNRALDKKNLESAGEAWGVVNRGIDKISKLVKDMLEYSSNKKPKLVYTDVNDLICQTAEEIEEKLISKGITLELDIEEDIEPRLMDELGLQRTLMNLFVNGLEAITHKQGNIMVTTALLPDNSVTITVKDNGSGIAREKLAKIFLPFYTTKGSSGTGLGLPMCKKAIEDMGGTMTVESEENVGTTFKIRIPFIDMPDSKETAEED